MGLLELNSDLSGGSTQLSSLSAASLQAHVIAPNSYGLFIQSNFNSQISSIEFDQTTGWIAIAGNESNNIVKQTITSNGYYQFDIDGNIFSSDRSSASFWQSIAGATRASVVGINFDGGLGYDTLTLENQTHSQQFAVTADDAIKIDGQIKAESIFFKAKDIINQGAIIAGNVTAEFSNNYTDVADAKIIAIDILLNGSKTGNLEATGQFLATGVMGGKIDLRGKAISLRGANLNASGENGGGTILIGGDYQGIDSGTLTNAESVFVDKYSSISANALTNGNGGKVIIWSDGDTDFRGNINARGGLKSGDGGLVEVSGKENLNFVGNVDVDATNGKQGSILLDPANIIINRDDHNDSTFDVSNLQKLTGDVTLSATNSIVFNTEAYFANSQGTITLQAGGLVKLGSFLTGSRNLNIVAGSINTSGLISSKSVDGNAGNITLKAKTSIDIGLLDAGTFNNGNGGNISLSAIGDISVATIVTSSNGSGKSGNVSLVSTKGSIHTDLSNGDSFNIHTSGESINTSAKGGNAGSVDIKAYGNIYNRSIYSNSNSGAGSNVNLTSTTGDIHGYSILTYASNGNGGNVTLNAYGNVTFNNLYYYQINGGAITAFGEAIASSSSSKNAGTIQVISSEGNIDLGQSRVSANSGQGNGANITLTAKNTVENRSITAGLIDAGANGNGNGGNIKLSAKGDILTSAIATNSNGNGQSGNVSLVSTDGSIKTINDSSDTADRHIYAGASGGDAGSITVNAFGDIVTKSIQAHSNVGSGGMVKLTSQVGRIDTNDQQIATYSNNSNAGNVVLNANQDIAVGEINAYAVSGGGKGGEVRIKANQDISTKRIYASSQSGSANNISITSVNGGIDTNGGIISATSVVGGNAGSITLNSTKNIKVGDIFARSKDQVSGVWNGGKVTLNADGDIETGNITTTSITGNAGSVTLKANLGSSVAGGLGIKVGNIDAFANGDGNAGDVKLNAGYDSDIKVLAIKTNVGGNGKGDGGEAYITGGGNIVVDSVRADSIGGKAGNVRLIASKTVRVTSAFSVNGENYSIYTDSVDDASGAKGGTVTIQHSTKIKNTPSPFTIGDSNINGTFSSISDGVIRLITEQGGVHEIGNNFNLNEIHIKGNNFLASQGGLFSALGFGINFLSYAFKDNKVPLLR